MTRSVQKRRNKNTMTDWEDLYHRNQLKSFRVGELEFYINHHNIAFKGKKDKKVWVVKAHIGGKILTSIVLRTTFSQPLTQIQSLKMTVTGKSTLLGLVVILQN